MAGCPRGPALGVPNFLFPESCAAVLARAAERREWLSWPLGEPPLYPDLDGAAARAADRCAAGSRARGRLAFAPPRRKRCWPRTGSRSAASHRCRELERAVAVAAEIGGPVALKADLAAPAHASDIDAVLLGLEGEPAVRSGWRELQRRVQAAGREWIGAIVQRLVATRRRHAGGRGQRPRSGPGGRGVGLGGRQAGLTETAAFRLPPATDAEADELIDSAKGVADRAGRVARQRSARPGGAARADPALHPSAPQAPEVVEADLNPVRCMTSGCLVLDMRLRIEHRRPVERVKTW